MYGRFLLIIAVDLLVVGAVTYWVVMHPGTLSFSAVVIAGVVGIAFLAVGAFRFLWTPMLADFPPQPQAPDAVRRRFQSVGLGIVNMGCSVHLSADEDFMHIEPLAIWQALGAAPASIPWSAMTPVGKSGRVVRVSGHRLDGPRWCLSLADDNTEAD